MKPRFGVLCGALLLVGALLVPSPTTAQTFVGSVRVFVDGQRVVFDQQPVVVNSRVLVPLRGVFERLGAVVEWEQQSSTVTAFRSDREVRLQIGSRRAYVDGQPVILDVPGMIRNGRTLVPLRFVSEAMGADVQWRSGTRTVLIASGGAGASDIPTAGQPPASAGSTIEGTFVRLELFSASQQRILIQRGSTIHAVFIGPDTVIRRIDSLGRGVLISADQLRPGETVRVTMDTSGRAAVITALSAQTVGQSGMITGRLDAVTTQVIVVSDQVYPLDPAARFYLNGQPIAREQLRAGMEVSILVNPQTGRVTEVWVGAQGIGPGTGLPAQPVIHSPAPGSVVGSPILIRGTATPGQQVLVRVDYRVTVFVIPIQGLFGEATTTADASGFWQVTISAPTVPLPGMSGAGLTISATAIDPVTGRRSTPAQVNARLV